MSELGRGRVVVKESRGHFIPDLPDIGKKNQVGELSRDSVTLEFDNNGYMYIHVLITNWNLLHLHFISTSCF
jgi:hypothetical protein